MKIATWNVNSVKARLPNVLDWLRAAQPDVVCFQEIKCVADAFPRLELGELGYNDAVCGQKSYNGVAILSKRPIEDVVAVLPGGDGSDEQARYIAATISGVRIASIYLPNGNPWPGEKFDYKLTWLDRLIGHAEALLAAEETFVLCGDYNVCPTDLDVYSPQAFANDALCRPESRARYRALLNLGLTDAFRALHPDEQAWTFWDYQAGAWRRNQGLRIDHHLLSPQAADRLTACDIDKEPRGRERASDHVPVICELRE